MPLPLGSPPPAGAAVCASACCSCCCADDEAANSAANPCNEHVLVSGKATVFPFSAALNSPSQVSLEMLSGKEVSPMGGKGPKELIAQALASGRPPPSLLRPL
eukprot:CAMPEP_0180736548 /NCGR_PEP_ID=MMETSP1038_2-20121128/23823_1 /TAXON_ID=632150 /ORGANISM="Azadinium spinosum, Strain 3D9" /LENGTH=102 /DNA_ID=CAMNT_0022769605 /DNA_START=64 /DNA_END=369 /DNA_ORIENTATION=-